MHPKFQRVTQAIMWSLVALNIVATQFNNGFPALNAFAAVFCAITAWEI